jgi:hypothetical protein
VAAAFERHQLFGCGRIFFNAKLSEVSERSVLQRL